MQQKTCYKMELGFPHFTVSWICGGVIFLIFGGVIFLHSSSVFLKTKPSFSFPHKIVKTLKNNWIRVERLNLKSR